MFIIIIIIIIIIIMIIIYRWGREPLFIWFEMIVFLSYLMYLVFSTVVVSLSCLVYGIATLSVCAFWTNKDR